MGFVRSVLLIDDNPSCNFIMSEFIKLADKHIEVQVTESVEQALDQLSFSDQFPEVIYVDLNMPILNGFDFIELFEKEFHLAHPKTKIFMLTSSLREEDKVKALTYESVQDFVSKNDIDAFLQQTLTRVSA